MRHPKQNEYERNARNRHAMLMQATMLGWEAVDILSAFHTPDGDLVVIDKDLKRYATTAEAEQLVNPEAAPTPPVVAPTTKTATPTPEQNKEIDVKHVVRHWQKTVLKEIRSAVLDGQFDLTMHSTIDYPRKAINAYSIVFSRMNAVLQGIKGPDWEAQLGLDNLEDSE